MPREAATYLWHALDAAELARSFVEGSTYEMFAADLKLQSAVERQLTIVGEALNRLSKEAPGTAGKIQDLPRIVGLRNILVHGYAEVDSAVIWRTVQTDLPGLCERLRALLGGTS